MTAVMQRARADGSTGSAATGRDRRVATALVGAVTVGYIGLTLRWIVAPLGLSHDGRNTAMFSLAARAMGRLGIEGDQLQAVYADFRRDPNRLADVVQRLVYQRDPVALKSWALERIERVNRSKPSGN